MDDVNEMYGFLLKGWNAIAAPYIVVIIIEIKLLRFY